RREGGLDAAQVVGRQLDRDRAEVLLQAVQFRRAGDRNDPRLLGQEPRQRDLRRGRPLLSRDLSEQLDQGLVGLAVLLREAGDDVAEVGLVEGRALADGAGEEALSQWAERDEADAEFLTGRQHLLLGLPPPERVL